MKKFIIMKKKNKRWSKRHEDVKIIRFWNPWSYSNERHEHCKSLNYDILGLGESHNKQKKAYGAKTELRTARLYLDAYCKVPACADWCPQSRARSGMNLNTKKTERIRTHIPCVRIGCYNNKLRRMC